MFKRKNEKYSSRLVFGRSKLITAELSGAVANVQTTEVVQR